MKRSKKRPTTNKPENGNHNKKEFYRVLQEVKEKENVKITFYENKNTFMDKAISAYVTDLKTTPHIFLMKPYFFTYRDLFTCLFHELGHIYDSRRYPSCKRSRIVSEYEYGSNLLHKVVKYPLYIKKAILLDEYIAESYIAKLLKKYSVHTKPEITQSYLDALCYLTLRIYKWELFLGIEPTRAQKSSWYCKLQEDLPMSPREYVNDLKTI